MEYKELWNYLSEQSAARKKTLMKEYIWIEKTVFETVKNNFKKEFNIFHIGKSLRSMSLMRHVHAIEQKNYYLLHKDIGNVAKFFPLGVFHLIADFIPLLLTLLCRRTGLYSYLDCPIHETKKLP